MKTLTYEDYLANPEAVKQQVYREARRERAEVVHRLIVAPLAQLFKRPAAKPAPIPNITGSLFQTRTA